MSSLLASSTTSTSKPSWRSEAVSADSDPRQDFFHDPFELTELVPAGDPYCDLVEAELEQGLDRDAEGHFELGREGGHTARRIVHAKDSTGWAIQEAR